MRGKIDRKSLCFERRRSLRSVSASADGQRLKRQRRTDYGDAEIDSWKEREREKVEVGSKKERGEDSRE